MKISGLFSASQNHQKNSTGDLSEQISCVPAITLLLFSNHDVCRFDDSNCVIAYFQIQFFDGSHRNRLAS